MRALSTPEREAVERELRRLQWSRFNESAIKSITRPPDSLVFGELKRIVLKTVGLAGPLEEALRPHADKIQAAFVFGSVATRRRATLI